MDPRRRWNEKEWLFRKVASKENLLERRYNFVKVKVNGDKSGIYSIEENFAKEFPDRFLNAGIAEQNMVGV